MSFLTDGQSVIHALHDYYIQSRSGNDRVINQKSIEQFITEFDMESFIQSGSLSENLVSFARTYLASTTRLHHPHFLAHQVAVPHYMGALASLIDGFTNNAMAIYEMGPGTSSIEFYMINWFCEKIGWKGPLSSGKRRYETETFASGVLTHGGSLANLTALICARTWQYPDVWQKGNPPNLALLYPKGAHYSIARAVGILGIGQDSLYPLEVDTQGAIKPDTIARVYTRLLEEGKKPLALIASACSTAVGIFDPLEEIGEFCRQNNVWFHVDGAHGASVLLSPRYRHRLKGIDSADSISWDAHKLLRVPVLCAALLVKNHKTIDQAFQQEASYLFHDKEQPGFDFIHRTIECTKAGLGLKVFMVLAAMGEKGLVDYIERQIELTEEIHAYLSQEPDITCATKPQCNILCFRIGQEDHIQLTIRDRLIHEGSFYLSSTVFNNKQYLRIALMNPDTKLSHIKNMVTRIRCLYKEITSPS